MLSADHREGLSRNVFVFLRCTSATLIYAQGVGATAVVALETPLFKSNVDKHLACYERKTLSRLESPR